MTLEAISVDQNLQIMTNTNHSKTRVANMNHPVMKMCEITCLLFFVNERKLNVCLQKLIQSWVSNITIEGQLLAFRGWCPFRMCIPNKPAKSWIKIIMIYDSGPKYMVDAGPISGANGNITRDNWYSFVNHQKKLARNPSANAFHKRSSCWQCQILFRQTKSTALVCS